MARNALCVFPRYSPSFGTFEYAFPLMNGVRGFMPPQGILVIASVLEERGWNVRFRDENVARASGQDFAWADAVFASGMHIQRQYIEDIRCRAQGAGKPFVLGGPSVSSAPENYPDADILHVGELGDATEELITYLEQHPIRPARQLRFETRERRPLDAFPIPAYHRIDLGRYMLGNVQATSGCPYRCEFCDIPELYGNNPRLKSPEQIVAELDAMLRSGNPGAVYFVDDNFVGNRKFAKQLLPHLIEWQKARGYPIEIACEATLNIAKSPDLLAMMREAYFTTVFCGIETPEPEALHAISKDHNKHVPMLEAVRTINSFGMQVVSGMIVGFDTDTPQTADRILEFIDQSQIPMLTINMLQALPRTPLWRRLEAEGRLYRGDDRETNIEYRMPYEEVLEMWRYVVREAYEPERLYRRFAHFATEVSPNRIVPPASPARVNPTNLKRGLTIVAKLLLHVGLRADYRRTFWKLCGPLLKEGKIEAVIHIGLVGHHLITYARDAVAGKQNASHYSAKTRQRVA